MAANESNRRILSWKTGFNTNLITRNIIDNRLLSHPWNPKLVWILPSYVISDSTIGFFGIDELICKKLLPQLSQLHPTETGHNLANIIVYRQVSRMMVWILVRLVFVGPPFWLLCRESAQTLKQSEPTIVIYHHLNKSKSFTLQRVKTMADRTGWRRIARLLIQQFVFATIIWSMLSIFMQRPLAKSPDPVLVMKWLLGKHLDETTADIDLTDTTLVWVTLILAH